MLKRVWKKIATVLLVPSGLGGAFLGLTLFQLGPGGHRLAGILIGWLYGIAVWGLSRLFRVAPSWAWLVGMLAGPIPIAVLMPNETAAGDRGVILFGLLAGLVLGLLEVAHARRSAHARAGAEEPR